MGTRTRELDRMAAVYDKSQAIGEFLDWLVSEKKFHLCVEHNHNGNIQEGGDCYRKHDHGKDACHVLSGKCKRKYERMCGFEDGEYVPQYHSTEKLLAEFFEIDLNKAEQERRAILKSLNSADASLRRSEHERVQSLQICRPRKARKVDRGCGTGSRKMMACNNGV